MYEDSNFVIHWPTLVIMHLFDIVFLMDVKWYLIVFLFCICLMANNEHILMCRLVICIYYSTNVYPDHVPILKLSFIIELYKIFIYSIYRFFIIYMIFKYFSPILWAVLDSILWTTSNFLTFMKSVFFSSVT